MENRSQIFNAIRGYLIAVWTVGAAFILTFVTTSLVEPGISPLFLLAVMISAWRGGLGAGLLATFLSAFAGAFVFIQPRFSLQIDRGDIPQLIIFTIAALIIGSLSAARKRAEEAREVLLVKEQTARIEAENANRVKDEFLAAVSHELRTPLTTIKTLTRVLQRREMTDDERAEYLADIASECDREIDLVLNLLDLSRIKAGGVQIRLQPVDVSDVIRACQKLVSGEAEKHNHRVEIEVNENLPSIRADHSALRRALCAIVENAIKFTPSEGRIELRAGKRNDEVTIEVADTGRGIAEEDIPHVFEKFYRGQNAGGVEAKPEEVPGIGLGLNLAKTLIEGMNGRISVESRLNQGTKFTIRLPVWTEDNRKEEIELSENNAASVREILSIGAVEKHRKTETYDETITRR